MPKLTPITVLAVLLGGLAVVLVSFAVIVEGDYRALALGCGAALVVIPSVIFRRVSGANVEVWQLVAIRFISVAPAAGLIAFGLGVQAVAAVAIGLAAGVFWTVLYWLRVRPKATD